MSAPEKSSRELRIGMSVLWIHTWEQDGWTWWEHGDTGAKGCARTLSAALCDARVVLDAHANQRVSVDTEHGISPHVANSALGDLLTSDEPLPFVPKHAKKRGRVPGFSSPLCDSTEYHRSLFSEGYGVTCEDCKRVLAAREATTLAQREELAGREGVFREARPGTARALYEAYGPVGRGNRRRRRSA